MLNIVQNTDSILYGINHVIKCLLSNLYFEVIRVANMFYVLSSKSNVGVSTLAACNYRTPALRCTIYDVVYLAGMDLFAYSASDHAIR